MKSIAVFVFLLLAVPGSGQLTFDGFPFSTRAEFVSLIVFLLALCSVEIRSGVRSLLTKWKWRGAIKPALLLLALVKLITFTWYPFSDGFDTCYRSVYKPLSDPEVCEKSYEGPFLLRSDLGYDNTSRIDRTIDYGVHRYDWSLPFMNEYPRLGTLWLERFPFTAHFGAMIRNDAEQAEFIPIFGNGEIEGTLGATSFGTSEIPLVDRYEFPRVVVLSVPPGESEFNLRYRFSDDDQSEPPSEAPPPRGPYASLKVGALQPRSELLEFLQLRLRGWTVDVSGSQTPDYLVALDENGNELGRGEPQPRPDVAKYVGRPNQVLNGFNFTIPARAITDSAVVIQALYGDSPVQIARIPKSSDLIPELPSIDKIETAGVRSEVSPWFDADRDEFEALAPDGRLAMGLTFNLIIWLLDLVSAVIVLGLLIALFNALRRNLLPSVVLALIGIALLYLGGEILPELGGSRLVVPLALLTLGIAVVAHRRPSYLFFTYLPVAVVVAVYKSFDHLERFHTSRGERWWGRLLYYWRDSDWYATQGYARRILIERSLQGGEAVFWFQAGPRYLAFLSRSLLGENDVLVGVIMTTLGFFAVLVLYQRFQLLSVRRTEQFVGVAMLFVLLLFMAEDLMAGFGFVGSSEFPTWIALLLVTGMIIHAKNENRAWLLVGVSIALGFSIQLRPNQIGGVILVFVAIMLLVNRTDATTAISLISRMFVAFALVVALSLLHNLYYGESFVPFTANAGINNQFSWLDVLGIQPGEGTIINVLAQLRYMMYWNPIGNYSWALMFWSSQLCWIGVVAYRARRRLVMKARSLYLLIPFGYALPMLKYQMTSYYPRHLVVINLSFLCAALMAWPRNDENPAEARVESPALSAANP